MTDSQRAALLARLAQFPEDLAMRVQGMATEDLGRVTDADPWSIAQVVHHCADSHMNSFVRLKLILTEDAPPLKGYNQDRWVTMADEHNSLVDASLTILRGLHVRWVTVFRHVQDDEWQRIGVHSEDGNVTVADLLRGYAQHCDEHLAQIDRILAAMVTG